jgi:hypothetical protein
MMIPEMMERRGVRNPRQPRAFAQRDSVRTLRSNKAVHCVKQRVPKLAMMIWLFFYRHIQNLAFYLDDVKIFA